MTIHFIYEWIPRDLDATMRGFPDWVDGDLISTCSEKAVELSGVRFGGSMADLVADIDCQLDLLEDPAENGTFVAFEVRSDAVGAAERVADRVADYAANRNLYKLSDEDWITLMGAIDILKRLDKKR